MFPSFPGRSFSISASARPDVRPTREMGEKAALAASAGPVAEGNVGAGTGATVGKIFGMKQAMKSGIGTASVMLGNGAIVAALVAVNALGDVIDPRTGQDHRGCARFSQQPRLSPTPPPSCVTARIRAAAGIP